MPISIGACLSWYEVLSVLLGTLEIGKIVCGKSRSEFQLKEMRVYENHKGKTTYTQSALI